MKRVMGRALVLTAICLAILASCPGAKIDNEDLIDTLKGQPKDANSWGDPPPSEIPNNIGNTFTGDPKNTRTITWQSTKNTGEVIIGNTRYPSTATPMDVVIDKNGTKSSYYFHRVDLTGLESGKTYSYIAGSSNSYSPVYSFKTESSSYPNGFSIIHITDPQIGALSTSTNAKDAAVWKRVIEAAIKKCPDAAFVVNSGDVVDKSTEYRVPYYFDYAQDALANYAFIYALGNNDFIGWYNKYFYIAANTANMSSDPSGVLYSFDYGNVHFISINMNFGTSYDDSVDIPDTFSQGQLTWLKDDLAATSKKWKVAIMHKPNYGRNSRTDANTKVTELFDTYNVNLVMGGHYHFYARTRPIDTAGNNKVNGTVWSIPNAAGNKFNDPSDQNYLAVSEKLLQPMFSELYFTADTIRLSAYTVDNFGNANLLNTYTLYPDSNTPAPDYTRLKLNEVNGVKKWFEIYNTGDADINLGGVKAYYDNASGYQLTWTGTALNIIPAKGYFTVTSLLTGLSANNANVKLQLQAPTGAVLDTYQKPAGINLNTGYPSLVDTAHARIPDGTGDWYYLVGDKTGTQGAANGTSTAGYIMFGAEASAP